MINNKDNITQLAVTKDGSAINMPFVKQGRAIEGADDSGNKVDEVGIIILIIQKS